MVLITQIQKIKFGKRLLKRNLELYKLNNKIRNDTDCRTRQVQERNLVAVQTGYNEMKQILWTPGLAIVDQAVLKTRNLSSMTMMMMMMPIIAFRLWNRLYYASSWDHVTSTETAQRLRIAHSAGRKSGSVPPSTAPPAEG